MNGKADGGGEGRWGRGGLKREGEGDDVPVHLRVDRSDGGAEDHGPA